MFCSADAPAGRAELRFARRAGRTVLADSRLTAPMILVRPFPLADGAQLVQLITLGPGLCGGDRIDVEIIAEAGANVVITTTAATRVLSMEPDAHAEQHVQITAEAGATIQYYPLVTIPFPESAFAQTVRVDAAAGSRVGVMETWALGRTARGEYLQFRSLTNRTTIYVDGALTYADVTELDPAHDDLRGIGVLAGRRYLASGVWHGVTLPERPQDGIRAASAGDLLAFGQSRPDIAYLRALADDAPALDRSLRCATDVIAKAWGSPPVPRQRFHN